MLTEERVREIVRHESDNGGAILVLVILLCFLAFEFIVKVDYRLERIETKVAIPACKVWDLWRMECK
jgi:hypothetical protein